MIGINVFSEKNTKAVKLLEAPNVAENKNAALSDSTPNQSKKKIRNKYKDKIQHNEVSTTTSTPFHSTDHLSTDSLEHLSMLLSNYKPRTYILVKLKGKWFDEVSFNGLIYCHQRLCLDGYDWVC